MVRIFDIQNGKVVASEHCYTMMCYKDIMDEYPNEHLNIYAYIHYLTCPNPDLNPFFDVPEVDKEEMVRKEVGGEFDADDDKIQYALDVTRKLYETPTSRAYQGIKIALDNMAKIMATEIPTFGRDGSATALLRIAEKFDAVRQSFKGVYRDLQEEQQGSVRGGQDLAYDQ